MMSTVEGRAKFAAGFKALSLLGDLLKVCAVYQLCIGERQYGLRVGRQ